MMVRNEKEPEVLTGDKADFIALFILMLGAALAIGISVYCKNRNKRVYKQRIIKSMNKVDSGSF